MTWHVEAGLRIERSRTHGVGYREAAEGGVLTVGRAVVPGYRTRDEGRGQTVVKNNIGTRVRLLVNFKSKFEFSHGVL